MSLKSRLLGLVPQWAARHPRQAGGPEGTISQSFFVPEHEDLMFFGDSRAEEFQFVALYDGSSKRLLEGQMYRAREEAEPDALRKPGLFEGSFVAIAKLREVTREEVEELGAQASSSPDTYREAFSRSFS